MEIQVLHEMVSRWYLTGNISNEEKLALSAEFKRIEGIPEDGRCTTCPEYYNDVQLLLRLHLKKNGFLVMAKSRKWQIVGGVYVPRNSSVHYVNEGVKSANIEPITDQVAERLMKLNPDLEGTIFVVDPDYVAPVKGAAGGASTESPAGSKKKGGKVQAPVIPPVEPPVGDGGENGENENDPE